MDKRPILMLTSVAKHEATLVDSGKKTRDGTPITKPQAVLNYNAAKKDVTKATKWRLTAAALEND
ncbi:hypothetical protein HPB49_022148 [Dermacentor silvarum]|uniref:Uncharacterized protein n=1 Tax=Dermacentor silvarum TaxID=543639 RepID=A0ACB8DG04_DERSI|nr:hypothetical protein HPB49_022148 [Dermacentor silvarum]